MTDDRARAAGVPRRFARSTRRCTSTSRESYRKVGELAAARDQLARGRASVDALPDDGTG